jgi:ring-1,2-phenylacetyl-CoA epoxidase subunit PaaB
MAENQPDANGQQLYEVFIQERLERSAIHVGSVRAASETLALHSAREIYARRENCVKLTIVNRKNMIEFKDSDFLAMAKDKKYRLASLEYNV